MYKLFAYEPHIHKLDNNLFGEIRWNNVLLIGYNQDSM